MEAVLHVDKLSKKYTDKLAANQISFTVEPGEVFALIGPNGAGKTTTLRMIATLIQPTAGDAFVSGHSIIRHPDKVRQSITYLRDEAGAYKSMTGKRYLDFMASLFSSDKNQCAQYVARAVEICGLGDRLQDKIGTYSRGMIRKLLLSRAVMTRPALAILDEPTSGLDILNALEIRRMIRSLANDGMSFLLSSHNMLEIEFVSDRVGIIANGVMHLTGTPAQLKKQTGSQNLEEVFERTVKTTEVSHIV